MVRIYKRKTMRQSWNEEAMNQAIMAVTGGMSLNATVKQYHVPKTTLARLVKKHQENPDLELVATKGLGRFTPVFSMEQERKLVSYLKEMEIALHGVSAYELRVLAFQLAEKNGIDHPFSEGLAGQDWLRGFLKRHPDIALRKPEATSAAQSKRI